MGLMLLNKFSFTLLFLLIISGSLLSTSFAGRRSKLINIRAADVDSFQEEEGTRKALNEEEEEVSTVRERLLRFNTKDYGRYDPPPVLSKPPFKLIPN